MLPPKRLAPMTVLALVAGLALAQPQAALAQVTPFSQSLAEAAAGDTAIATFYQSRGYAPFWTAPDQATRRAALFTALERAGDHGLPVARYDAGALAQAIRAARTEGDLGRLEVALTRAFLTYARDVHSGVLQPAKVDPGILREVTYDDPLAVLSAFEASDPAAFLRDLDPAVTVFPMGVGSNLIVRDGGIRAVVIRLGRGFNGIAVDGTTVTAGAAALDAHVARKSAEAGLDLTFLRTIPGSIGGAVRMNAGCYGAYVADNLLSVRVVTRAGEVRDIPAADLHLAYRSSTLPEGWVIVSAQFRAVPGDPDALEARMQDQIAKRDASQPTKDRSAGSTFRNPAGFSSTGRADDSQDLKAWKVIDDAGMRGATLGGAQMSPKHSNFLINIGGATAADLENLGEEVRKRVFQQSGITLEWEIMRVGETSAE